jgi:hypothetical protein
LADRPAAIPAIGESFATIDQYECPLVFEVHRGGLTGMQYPLISQKATRFTESVIRGMSVEARKYNAVNLAQGMPDFPAPREVKAAACRAIEDDINQYAITWGAKGLREAIADHAGW